MKKFLPLFLICASVAFAQVLSGSVFTSYTEQNNTQGSPTLGPTLATQGIPLLAPTKPNQPIKYVNVTLQGIWDAGQGFQITGASARAWKFSPQRVCAYDGGSSCISNFDAGVAFAWARYPILDFGYATDSGTPYVQHGPGGLTFSTGIGAPYGAPYAAPSFNGSRLYYTIEALTTADAGTMANARVLLEGVY